jgi:hypothetical protein
MHHLGEVDGGRLMVDRNNNAVAHGPSTINSPRSTNSRRGSPTGRGIPLRTGRLKVRILPAAPFAGVASDEESHPRGPCHLSPATRNFHGASTGRACRAAVLTRACLRESGASPRRSAICFVRVAQLAEARRRERRQCRFDSCRGHQLLRSSTQSGGLLSRTMPVRFRPEEPHLIAGWCSQQHVAL